MIKSMTGFGRHEQEYNSIPVLIEIKTVNHRYFDFSCRLNRMYNFLEEKLKSYIQSKISRGKIDVFVSIGTDNDTPCEVEVNHSLASGYIASLKELKSTYELDGEVTVGLISKFPDVFTVKKAPIDEEKIWSYIKDAADKALESLIDMRLKEGRRLKEDIILKASKISSIVDFIEKKSPETVAEYQKRLEEKIRETLENYETDNMRILTEVAIFADKVAVDEEIVRLRSHFNQLYSMLESDEAVGRKLDFLLQEMNRETNTIGSKATDAEIAHYVVDIKAELEKIREQIQNIE